MQIRLEDRPVKWLRDNVQRVNICEDFAEADLNAIGNDVVQMAEMDESSRSSWRERTEKGMRIAMQMIEDKTFPWPGCANTKDTLIAEAAMQFSARASAEIVKGGDVVRTKVTGNDKTGAKEARGKRVGQYMSYECTDIMTEWEPDTEQLLTSVAIIGMYYKKTYRDGLLKRSVSMSLSPMQVIVNESAKTLELAERVTHCIPDKTRNQIIERIRSGEWADILDKLGPDDDDGKLYEFYESHCWYDLDNDGYKEPYVITVHKETGAVCKICTRYDEDAIELTKDNKVAKITPLHHFTEFVFLYSPDGKYHKVGFAQLLGPITEMINTTANQLLDAGTLANLPPVFVGKGAKLPAGGIKVHPGKMNVIESTGQALRDNIVVQQMVGPSDVLFKMLGLLKENARKLATVSDTMQGDMPGANVPATTTLALLDQGLKVFSSILVRLFRAFKSEYAKLYRLDSLYLTDAEYANVVDFSDEDVERFKQMGYDQNDPRWIVSRDFSAEDCDVQPVMDPRAASEALRLARLNAMAQAAGMPPAVGRLFLEGIGVPKVDIDKIFPEQSAPDPAMIKIQAEIEKMKIDGEIKTKELELKLLTSHQKQEELEIKIARDREEVALLKSQAILNLAKAEAAEVGTQIDTYNSQLRELEIITAAESAAAQAAERTENGTDISGGRNAGGTGTVGAQQDNAQGNAVSGGAAPTGNGDMGGGSIPPGLGGAGGNMDAGTIGQTSGVQPSVRPQDVAEASARPGSMM